MGLTVAELATVLGCGRETIYRWEAKRARQPDGIYAHLLNAVDERLRELNEEVAVAWGDAIRRVMRRRGSWLAVHRAFVTPPPHGHVRFWLADDEKEAFFASDEVAETSIAVRMLADAEYSFAVDPSMRKPAPGTTVSVVRLFSKEDVDHLPFHVEESIPGRFR